MDCKWNCISVLIVFSLRFSKEILSYVPHLVNLKKFNGKTHIIDLFRNPICSLKSLFFRWFLLHLFSDPFGSPHRCNTSRQACSKNQQKNIRFFLSKAGFERGLLLKWLFLASFLLNFSTVCLHMLAKFIKNPAQKQLIFPTKASFERSLISQK